MNKLNINELIEYSKKEELNKLKLFNELLGHCHKRIKHCAKNRKLECIYEVPVYTFGYPLYKHNEASDFIVNALKENGFIINTFDRYIHISWNFDKKTKNKKSKKIEDNNEYKHINDYKNINEYDNNIYNTNELMNLKNKSIKFLNI